MHCKMNSICKDNILPLCPPNLMSLATPGRLSSALSQESMRCDFVYALHQIPHLPMLKGFKPILGARRDPFLDALGIHGPNLRRFQPFIDFLVYIKPSDVISRPEGHEVYRFFSVFFFPDLFFLFLFFSVYSIFNLGVKTWWPASIPW